MSTVFYCPGRMGDSLHQWPVAFWWHRETGQPFEMWIDEPTCAPLKPLYEIQPGVSKVVLTNQSKAYNCGGQPWGGDFPMELHAEHTIYSLGLRAFPSRQLTLQAFQDCVVKPQVEPDVLAETPCLTVPAEPKANRVVLHGTGICHHNKQTPAFWRFLAGIRGELEAAFDEIVFVGSDRDREVGAATYPNWTTWSDDGDFAKLASYIAASRLMIGCGSAPVVLAGLLKVPAIRVHDPLGDAPKVIWSNLGKTQLNATELELRTLWPEFRDTYVTQEVTA